MCFTEHQCQRAALSRRTCDPLDAGDGDGRPIFFCDVGVISTGKQTGLQMTKIPTIQTDRLTLRPMRAADWSDYHQLMASERSIYMGGPFCTAAAWGMFCADHAQWSLFGCGALMIDTTAAGNCIGQVSINAGPLYPEYELGWMLFPGAEGQGFAFEAATALREWGQGVEHIDTLVSYVDPENLRSINLAQRLGATLDSCAPRPDPTDLVYRHYG